ncbi:CopG domain protein DNA-binding domain protein [Desulfofarcimen acetoxidans DSM 771]|jgi:predicted transcriptional regulator|uniref:CopG domain protein DNA-binding domain protein n=1 Tax=Desulfofarcimen acetoxidans (strain ATCC 49208 / DSM 771 / KCTC 5769 / VKM B-1644 / 5575) TaxID=485916 RepID=C8VXI9_DESAS|nr:ribbon-helix-helix protein, CopG family [Desulfofarcimen acetoxidans]ACV62645.1 CopG domain protein DNA-binding domain protein [Desulfofarcimen acetoxidans DSM 771]
MVKDKYARLTVRIDPELKIKLDNYREKSGKQLTAIIREALTNYLSEKDA